jgi:hypothetical protein
MPIATSLFLGLVTDKVVNDPLVDPLACERGDEAVPHDVPAAHGFPSTASHCTAKVHLWGLRRENAFARPEQERTAVAFAQERANCLFGGLRAATRSREGGWAKRISFSSSKHGR